MDPTYFSRLPNELLREIDLYAAFMIPRDAFGYVPPKFYPFRFRSWYSALWVLKVDNLGPKEFERRSLFVGRPSIFCKRKFE